MSEVRQGEAGGMLVGGRGVNLKIFLQHARKVRIALFTFLFVQLWQDVEV